MPWQQLGWSHRTITSTALLALRASQQERLGSGEEEEEGEREKGREGGEDLMSLPQRPGLSLTWLGGLWTKLKRGHQLILRAGLPHHWDPVLLLCSCQSISPVILLCKCESLHQAQRKEGGALHPQGSSEPGQKGKKVQNNDLGRRKSCPFSLQNVPRIHSLLSTPWPQSWLILSPPEKAF